LTPHFIALPIVCQACVLRHTEYLVVMADKDLDQPGCSLVDSVKGLGTVVNVDAEPVWSYRE